MGPWTVQSCFISDRVWPHGQPGWPAGRNDDWPADRMRPGRKVHGPNEPLDYLQTAAVVVPPRARATDGALDRPMASGVRESRHERPPSTQASDVSPLWEGRADDPFFRRDNGFSKRKPYVTTVFGYAMVWRGSLVADCLVRRPP